MPKSTESIFDVNARFLSVWMVDCTDNLIYGQRVWLHGGPFALSPDFKSIIEQMGGEGFAGTMPITGHSQWSFNRYAPVYGLN